MDLPSATSTAGVSTPSDRVVLTLALRTVVGGGELLPDSEVVENWVAERDNEITYTSITVGGDGSFSSDFLFAFAPGQSTLEFVAVTSLAALFKVADHRGPWYANEGESVVSLGLKVEIEGT